MPKSLEMRMIQHLSIMTGNLLGALACGDDEKMKAVDHLLTAYQSFREGTPDDDTYRAQLRVAENLRFGFDKMMAVHHAHREKGGS
ncbi:hypothetical protein [Asaia astilbis]|uniref:hypothetical protein n=1 Tax=Asaia astilbis TaxID=610244 RepID=UPI00046FA61F|nr:hypothetical protein [Asaia astilbis]